MLKKKGRACDNHPFSKKGVGMSHRKFTQEERYQIQALNRAGHKRSQIAEQLGRSRSTISRELKRNGKVAVGGAVIYDSEAATKQATSRRRHVGGRRVVLSDAPSPPDPSAARMGTLGALVGRAPEGAVAIVVAVRGDACGGAVAANQCAADFVPAGRPP